ncbi:MAG: hypothetical protein KAS86_05500 [Candidatus Omnitrophica bacterium]|nr:hypothetical protein [Candidatus Omnitrophota bacterium]
MSQYYPAYKAGEHGELSRRISSTDYYSVINKVQELDLNNGWIQPFDGDFETRFKGEAL